MKFNAPARKGSPLDIARRFPLATLYLDGSRFRVESIVDKVVSGHATHDNFPFERYQWGAYCAALGPMGVWS